jgi:hypothetical protein
VNLVFADRPPAGCAGKCAFLRERGFQFHTASLQCGVTAGVALTKQCGPGGWPGPRYFHFFATDLRGITRIKNPFKNKGGTILTLDNSLFVLLY